MAKIYYYYKLRFMLYVSSTQFRKTETIFLTTEERKQRYPIEWFREI